MDDYDSVPLTDVEWIAAVRKYLLEFDGSYGFSLRERLRLKRFLTGTLLTTVYAAEWQGTWRVNFRLAHELLDAMEQGIVDAVTRKLTGN